MLHRALEVLNSPNPPKIAVVLGSGGIRPAASVALFKFLDESHIPIDLLIGCSGGSILAAMKAIGFSTEEIIKHLERLNQSNLVSDLNYRTIAAMLGLPFCHFNETSALIKPNKLQKALREIFQDWHIENLKTKLLIQTTDVHTGQGILFEKGRLSEITYASSAILPFFPPIKIDDLLLADGGFSCSLPVLEATLHHADIIISMDFNKTVNYKPTSILNAYTHLINICDEYNISLQRALAINYHHHEIICIQIIFTRLVEMWETDALPLIFEQGRMGVEKAKNSILEAIAQFKPKK